MMKPSRFTENETGIEVSVEGVFGWPPLCHAVMIVTYPSGRRFAVPERAFALHFSIVTPQEVFISAFGGVDERPTAQQRAAQDKAD